MFAACCNKLLHTATHCNKNCVESLATKTHRLLLDFTKPAATK